MSTDIKKSGIVSQRKNQLKYKAIKKYNSPSVYAWACMHCFKNTFNIKIENKWKSNINNWLSIWKYSILYNIENIFQTIIKKQLYLAHFIYLSKIQC